MKKILQKRTFVTENFKVSVLAAFLLCLTLQLWAFPASDTGQRVTVRLKNAPSKELFAAIRKQTQLDFVYSDQQMEKISPVTIDATDELVENVLNKVLVSTPYTYTIKGNSIAIVARQNLKEREKSLFFIKGIVMDSKKELLPGVTVRLEKSSIGTATDIKGYFILTVPNDKGYLEISSVGYATQKVGFVSARDTLYIVMQEEIKSIDEVTVVAYGTTTRREMTGSISVVKAEEIQGIPSSNIANLLQGRVAGMDVTNLSGSPGGGGTVITIRGYNSLDVEQGRRFSNPLWVVDGVPLSSFTSPITGTNLLSDLNPDLIESIQVLKDASAATLYGSRAANGVIIVTTKKGRKNQNATFSVNVSQSWSILPELPTITIGRAERNLRLQALSNSPTAYLDPETNRYKYPENLEEVYVNSLRESPTLDEFFTREIHGTEGFEFQDSLNPFYNNATNFFPMYYAKGKVTNANIQTYGGNEQIVYGIGLGFYNESGILKGTGFNRIDLNSNMTVNPVERLTLDLRLNGSLTNRRRGTYMPNNRLQTSSGIETVPGDPYSLSSLYPGEGSEVWNEIIRIREQIKEKNRSLRMRSNFKVGYDIIAGLNLSTSLAADYSLHRRHYFQPSILAGDKLSISTGETAINLMVLNENLLNYQKTVNESHNFNVVVGLSYQYDQAEYNGGWGKKSPSDKIQYVGSGFPALGQEKFGDFVKSTAYQKYESNMEEKKLLSYFGRFEYNFQKKYLLSASFRKDGCSVFGERNRWGTFPSVAAGWTFSEEHFMKGISDILSFGKIRASWGRSGMHFSSSYLALGIMSPGSAHQGSSTLTPQLHRGLYNEELSWEETDQYDFGLDLDFFNYRLGVTLDYYYRYTDKLLMPITLPGNYNGYYQQWRNAAAISNEGIELLIKYDILRKKDLYWKISVNAAKNWNRYEKSYDGKDNAIGIIGKALNGIYTFKTEGYINTQEEMDIFHNATGVGNYLSPPYKERQFYKPGDYKIVDVNGDGAIYSSDKVYAGSALPMLSGGIVNEFRWKNFDLNFSMSFQLGRHIVNTAPLASLGTNASNRMHPVLMDLSKVTFWEKPGDDHADFAKFQTNNNTYLYPDMREIQLDRYVEKVNWLKMKTMTLGYNLPKTFMKSIPFEQIRLFVSGENLFTVTNYSGMDPETVSIITGIDEGNTYPLARRYTIGLTIKF